MADKQDGKKRGAADVIRVQRLPFLRQKKERHGEEDKERSLWMVYSIPGNVSVAECMKGLRAAWGGKHRDAHLIAVDRMLGMEKILLACEGERGAEPKVPAHWIRDYKTYIKKYKQTEVPVRPVSDVVIAHCIRASTLSLSDALTTLDSIAFPLSQVQHVFVPHGPPRRAREGRRVIHQIYIHMDSVDAALSMVSTTEPLEPRWDAMEVPETDSHVHILQLCKSTFDRARTPPSCVFAVPEGLKAGRTTLKDHIDEIRVKQSKRTGSGSGGAAAAAAAAAPEQAKLVKTQHAAAAAEAAAAEAADAAAASLFQSDAERASSCDDAVGGTAAAQAPALVGRLPSGAEGASTPLSDDEFSQRLWARSREQEKTIRDLVTYYAPR